MNNLTPPCGLDHTPLVDRGAHSLPPLELRHPHLTTGPRGLPHLHLDSGDDHERSISALGPLDAPMSPMLPALTLPDACSCVYCPLLVEVWTLRDMHVSALREPIDVVGGRFKVIIPEYLRPFALIDRPAPGGVTSNLPGGELNLTFTWAEHAFLDQQFAEFHAVLVIDVEQLDGDTADGRAADQVGPLPAEMRCPFVPAGVEQRRNLAGLLVEAGQVGTLKRIAIVTA